ncbi:hypothetical protein DPMN_121077 [Dreissena polymorpha]|uniref:Uncharacterized protein n=1 Tax=Dreissena polymorpha TaxID=45954 RepID=A0A9D4GQ53_DREPO|nr:hypothetical protein DPMN_121077 [Dreissena polymorpha]
MERERERERERDEREREERERERREERERKVCERPDTQTYRQTYIFPFETSACAPSYGAERDIHTMKSPSP